jgi:hypothetical protein
MTVPAQRRRTADTLLLSLWVFGYSAMIRFFAALQLAERIVSTSKRADVE